MGTSFRQLFSGARQISFSLSMVRTALAHYALGYKMIMVTERFRSHFTLTRFPASRRESPSGLDGWFIKPSVNMKTWTFSLENLQRILLANARAQCTPAPSFYRR